MNQSANGYDLVPYPSVPFRQSHPNQLATIATLMGLQPPAVAGCRVLELGCGRGDNLIPLALELPTAHLVGIDLSQRHVDMASESIADLGIANLRMEQGDILELPADLGEFDFVIAHGVYSWIPDPVRDALLAACRRHLAPDGIAYVSYNTFPGWRERGVARDALLFHTRATSDPATRIRDARAFVAFMGRVIPESIPGYRDMWRRTLDLIDSPSAQAALLYHDFLEPDNTPVYFTQFVAHAGEHGLRYVSESRLGDMMLEVLGEEVVERLRALGDDVIAREQYRDFIINRTFRHSLLCHDTHEPRPLPDPAALGRLHVAGEMQPDGDQRSLADGSVMSFRKDETVVGLDRAIAKAAAVELGEAWPQAVRFDELLSRARRRLRPRQISAVPTSVWEAEERTLAGELLQLALAEFVELDIAPPRFASEPGERPLAYRWAQRQARVGEVTCNLRHNGVKLDEVAKELLLLLDGTRDHETLARDLAAAVTARQLVLSDDGREVEGEAQILALVTAQLPAMLAHFAGLALLVEQPAPDAAQAG